MQLDCSFCLIVAYNSKILNKKDPGSVNRGLLSFLEIPDQVGDDILAVSRAVPVSG